MSQTLGAPRALIHRIRTRLVKQKNDQSVRIIHRQQPTTHPVHDRSMGIGPGRQQDGDEVAVLHVGAAGRFQRSHALGVLRSKQQSARTVGIKTVKWTEPVGECSSLCARVCLDFVEGGRRRTAPVHFGIQDGGINNDSIQGELRENQVEPKRNLENKETTTAAAAARTTKHTRMRQRTAWLTSALSWMKAAAPSSLPKVRLVKNGVSPFCAEGEGVRS